METADFQNKTGNNERLRYGTQTLQHDACRQGTHDDILTQKTRNY